MIYDYRCPNCGLQTVRRSMGCAPEWLSCNVCGERAPRVFTPPNVIIYPTYTEAYEESVNARNELERKDKALPDRETTEIFREGLKDELGNRVLNTGQVYGPTV